MPGVVAKPKESKNQRRRALKKTKKQDQEGKPDDGPSKTTSETVAEDQPAGAATAAATFETPTTIAEDDPLYAQFKNVFDKFQDADQEEEAKAVVEKPEIYFDDDDEIPDEENEERKISLKKRKEMSKLSIAELKALVRKPELVEWTDTDAPDPRLLVAIKAHRNVVPVPLHWSLKREYLSSKRGVEKASFALPKFIQDTGIAEMRDAVHEKQAEQSLKQKQRERVQPKMGKLDIDYQKLYEAFFRFQTKPEMTRYGEVYYEGKEYETNLRHLRPGELGDELKEALGMPAGAPPPWLINQQRWGPPPSYPVLKIPGLNAPPPPGSAWGFHPGGYGKPPTDEKNNPLYGGDIFGVYPSSRDNGDEVVDKTIWGELKPPEDDEEEEEEEEDDEDEEAVDEDDAEMAAGVQTSRTTAGMASVQPSEYGGTQSVDGDFTLRKQRPGTQTEETPHPRSAGQVLQERETRTAGFFGSDRGYDLRGVNGGVPVLGQEDTSRKRKVGDIDVSIDVDALERDDKISKDQVSQQYEAQRNAKNSAWAGRLDQDELDKMIAEESRKRLKKDQERRGKR